MSEKVQSNGGCITGHPHISQILHRSLTKQMDLTDFDSSLLVWGEDVNLVDKAIHNGNLASHDLVLDGSADTIEQVTLALLNGDSSNNTNLMPLLNNFVSAMADQSMSSVALGQSGEGSFHYPLYGSNPPLLSPPPLPHLSSQVHNTIEADPKQGGPGPVQHIPMDLNLTQRQAKLPQHLMINEIPNVKDIYSIQASTNGNGRTLVQPIFPPNYFLPPGMIPWDPTATHNTSPKVIMHNDADRDLNSSKSASDTFYCDTNSTSTIHGASLMHPQHCYSQTNTMSHPTLLTAQTSDHSNYTNIEALNKWKGEERLLQGQGGMFQAPNGLLLSSYLDAQRWHNSNGSSHVAPSNSSTGPNRSKGVPLISNKKNTTDRNEREQRRAQQIAELIDELRDNMVKAGWKVELKGKYHTLSRCVEYLLHLKKVTKEKEDALERTKAELSIRKQRMDEEKTVVESRSDPESVISQISSLTDEDNPVMPGLTKKRWSEHVEMDDHQHKSKKISSESESNHNGSEDGAISSESELRTNDGRKNVSIGNMCSSISDITDKSIKSSGNGSSPSHHSSIAPFMKDGGDCELEAASSSSISSTAAVFSGVGSNDRQSRNVDVSVNRADKISGHRSKRRIEVSSQHKNFVLDYEEVFRTSNIPQLIAAPSGHVIACNDFFLQCLGLQSISNMTLFSFVHPEKLADLFELISKQLRLSKNIELGDNCSKYESITLPCIEHPSNKDISNDNIDTSPPMFMHVTLIGDSDPNRRCFHCLLTDVPGTEGKIGSISIDMLSRMFFKKSRS